MDDMLNDAGVNSELRVVVDANAIDREVTDYKPTHVVIEALWVTPTKFYVLQKLHPEVTWIIRLHSELPFLAQEGIAMDWLGDYLGYQNVVIGVNAPRMMQEVLDFADSKFGKGVMNDKLVYLPNFYPQEYVNKSVDKSKEYIDIGCFGAVRPLKNHMLQAVAAVKFADSIGKKLRFHINAGRVEMKGEPVLHNLRGFFAHLSNQGHELVSHTWTPREEFLQLCAKMDIGMQCSFSETFNIVGADLISQGVPLVTSSEIPWHSSLFSAEPTESEQIYKALLRTYNYPRINTWANQYNLTRYTNKTRKIWLNYFKDKK
jgi:hypothetical protein